MKDIRYGDLAFGVLLAVVFLIAMATTAGFGFACIVASVLGGT